MAIPRWSDFPRGNIATMSQLGKIVFWGLLFKCFSFLCFAHLQFTNIILVVFTIETFNHM